MQDISLDRLVPLFDGVVEVRRRAGALQALRVPAAELPLYDPFTRFVATMPGGARLRLRSDTRRLQLTLSQRRMQTDGNARPASFDLFIDGVRVQRNTATGGALLDAATGKTSGDERAEIEFADLAAGDKHIELWLPQFASIYLTGCAIDDGATLRLWPDVRQRIVFHGSSITHCAEATGPSDAWPAVAARAANARHLNLGWAGSCLLSGLAARIIRDQPANAIVLKLGINVSDSGLLKERTFADSAHAMIAIIREKHPRVPLALVSPIYSPPRETHSAGGGMTLEQMRATLSGIAQTWQTMGDVNLHYLDGLELFNAADIADLPDALHPNAAGYLRMGERFAQKMLAPGQPLALPR